MAIHVLNGLDMNSTKIENLGAPVSANDAVRLADLNSAVEGLSWKDSCRVATSASITLASPGSSIDSVTMSNGDRVLVKAQSAPAENGIYIFNGASTAMTRALDANTTAELEAAITTVEEGTAAGTTWRQTQVNFTLGTNDVLWTQFGASVPNASETAAGIIEIATQAEVDAGTSALLAVTPAYLAGWASRPKRYAANVGDGSNATISITHNLGTTDVQVQLSRVGSPYDIVWTDIERTNTNTVTLKFATAPTTNQFRVVVLA